MQKGPAAALHIRRDVLLVVLLTSVQSAPAVSLRPSSSIQSLCPTRCRHPSGRHLYCSPIVPWQGWPQRHVHHLCRDAAALTGTNKDLPETRVPNAPAKPSAK
ncbi:hypothetical protein P171DRAFT_463698 [Karstenula rhodostoma CBS 690.94]|uniref:Secreted protein n=1 Tax=Karstenula rhodostoma CBS 690.94 TaxID=1392251 RepID=A0A9P4PHR5_9PLEO|nr:hypothetical protein P171DRAFT_463698 [Karstenula rhodostoma CBS 690.94]